MKPSTDLHQTGAIRLLGDSARTTAAPIPSSRIELPDAIAAAIPLDVSMIKTPHQSIHFNKGDFVFSWLRKDTTSLLNHTTSLASKPTGLFKMIKKIGKHTDWITPGTGVYTMFFSTTHLEPACIPDNDSYHRTLLKPNEPFIVNGEEE